MKTSTGPDSLRDAVKIAFDVSDTYIRVVDLETESAPLTVGDADEILNTSMADTDSMGEFFETAIHPDDIVSVESAYQELVTGDTEWIRVEYRTHPDNGPIQWVETYVRLNNTGEGRQLVAISTDITERKEYEQELADQNERLEQVASVLSHDLRNPLQVAMGHVELAQEANSADHLDTVARMLEQMEDWIDDMLASIENGESIIRGGGMTKATETADLSETAKASWERVSTADATLNIETEQTVRAGQASLQQLFENLFRNAVEHGGSNVTVTVGSLEDPDGFYVGDDGQGLSEVNESQMFDAGYTTAEAGTGLGLHIVSEIIEAHDWEISVTESKAGGARFEITGVTIA